MYCSSLESRLRKKIGSRSITQNTLSYMRNLGRQAKLEEDLHISTAWVNTSPNDNKEGNSQTWSYASSMMLLEVVLRDECFKREVKVEIVQDKKYTGKKEKKNGTTSASNGGINGSLVSKSKPTTAAKRYIPSNTNSKHIPSVTSNGKLNVMGKSSEIDMQKQLFKRYSGTKSAKKKSIK